MTTVDEICVVLLKARGVCCFRYTCCFLLPPSSGHASGMAWLRDTSPGPMVPVWVGLKTAEWKLTCFMCHIRASRHLTNQLQLPVSRETASLSSSMTRLLTSKLQVSYFSSATRLQSFINWMSEAVSRQTLGGLWQWMHPAEFRLRSGDNMLLGNQLHQSPITWSQTLNQKVWCMSSTAW